MATHQEIDRRSLRLAQAVALRIDENVTILDRVRHWAAGHSAPAMVEWQEILKQDWPQVREVLLEASDDGQRLRQSSPFVGVLKPQERWQIYRESLSD